MPVISAQELTKQYGNRTGVLDVDLEVERGAIFGFLGPNGSGKTTLIRLLLGLLRPTGGRAFVLGRDAWKETSRLKRDVGYLPGDLRLYPWMTVDSALSVAGRIRGMDLHAPSVPLLERLQLTREVKVRQMSRGMRQKLGLLLALAHDPQLIILDEPTLGLDPLTQDVLMDILRNRAERGYTVFFSSHTLSEVEALCHRVAIVRRGKVVANEAIDTLRQRARRVVNIEFESGNVAKELQPPDGLDVINRSDNAWEGAWDGPARDLVQWVANQPVRDLTIGPPNLERLFRAFYREDELAPNGNAMLSEEP